MTADWNKPNTSSSKTSFPVEIRDADTANCKLLHTGESNLPTGAIQYNRTTYQLEEWSGAAWATTPVGTPVGAVMMWLSATAPTGYLLLQGGTISKAGSGGTARANADCEPLFTFLWNNLANAEAPVSTGRGSTAALDFAAGKTLTLPDMKQRFPIGKHTSGTGATLGGTGGFIDHTHTVKAHYHGMGSGASLNITASGSGTSGLISNDHTHTATTNGAGSHSHSIVYQVGTNTGSGNNGGPYPLFGPTSNGTHDSPYSTLQAGAAVQSPGDHAHTLTTGGVNSNHNHTIPTHTHPAGNIAGAIGLVTGGVDGNAAQQTEATNPPFLAMNFIIKY